MARIAFDIAIIWAVYLIGYKMGYKTCYRNLVNEFKKFKEKYNHD